MTKYRVIVGLSNPKNVARLMRIGCMMANEFDGQVVAFTVVETDCDAPERTPECHDRMSRAYQILDTAEELAKGCSADFRGTLSVGREVPEVLDEVAKAENASLIIVGYSEREHPNGTDSRFERLVDEIASHAPCSLLIANFRGEEKYDRVLVPVRANLSLDIRRDLLVAMQDQFGSDIDFVHFARSDQEAMRMHDQLEQWLAERKMKERATLQVDVQDNPAQAIVDASAGYDLVVLGTAPLHEVRRKFFGAVPEYVAANAPCSTFLVRMQDIQPHS